MKCYIKYKSNKSNVYFSDRTVTKNRENTVCVLAVVILLVVSMLFIFSRIICKRNSENVYFISARSFHRRASVFG